MKVPSYAEMHPMSSVLSKPVFSPLLPTFEMMADAIHGSQSVQISAPASIEGMLCMAHLEAACIDLKKKYVRRFFLPKHFRARDEPVTHPPHQCDLSILVNPEEETWSIDGLSKIEDEINLVPVEMELFFEQSSAKKRGAIDCVTLSALLANFLAASSHIVRRLQSTMLLGQWLRTTLDHGPNPMYSMLVDVLQEDGLIRCVPMVEVEVLETSMFEDFPQRRFNKLKTRWEHLDRDEKAQALSELLLPMLEHRGLSTQRFEELAFRRILRGDESTDLMSQLSILQHHWPTNKETLVLHVSTQLDFVLKTGQLIDINEATG